MSGPPDFNALLQQAQVMQQKMLDAQRDLEHKTVEASSGGGMVTVIVAGNLELRALRIDPQAIDPKDPTLLQDLVIAAVNQGIAKAQELAAQQMRTITGGMGIPGIPGLTP